MCFESYHWYCLVPSGKREQFESKVRKCAAENAAGEFVCPKCQSCQVCQKPPRSSLNLFCHRCDRLYHFGCLFSQQRMGVQFDTRPESLWRCQQCFQCQRCGTNAIIDAEMTNVQINLDICENFTLCYRCALIDAFHKFCRLCNRYCARRIEVGAHELPAASEESAPEGQALDDLIQLDEEVFHCQQCRCYFHVKCVLKHQGFDRKKNMCEKCLQSSLQEVQRKYEELLIKVKKRLIFLKKIQEFHTTLDSILEERFPATENLKEDIADFIVQNLNFLESDR